MKLNINPRKAFMIANAAMVLGCVFFVYVISTSVSSEQPADLQEAELWLAHLESQPVDGGDSALIEDPTGQYLGIKNPNPIMQPVYTQTPKPTPTPAPTATPVPLSQIIGQWTPVGMDETLVTILNQQTGEEFDMELNGPARTVEAGTEKREVRVIEINLDADPPYVKFDSGGDTATKAL